MPAYVARPSFEWRAWATLGGHLSAAAARLSDRYNSQEVVSRILEDTTGRTEVY